MLVLPILLINCIALVGQCGRLQNTEEGDDLVTATCKHTLHYQVCVSSLRSVPSSKTCDLKGLAKIALNLSTQDGAKTLSYVYELKSSAASGTTNNTYMSSCLSDCADEYLEAIENLQDAAQALANEEYDKVDALVSAAMSDAETCEDGLKDSLSDNNGSHSPLTERNRYFSDLCSNVLAIVKLLV